MPTLHQQRCFNHALREAVARCPECTRYFCRECVTEHDGRVVCAACLARLAQAAKPRPQSAARLVRVLQFTGAVLLAWFFFFLAGAWLLRATAPDHAATLWQAPADPSR